MSKGPRVSLSVVCDGCEYLCTAALLRNPPQYQYECRAPGAPEIGKRTTGSTPLSVVTTPHWCPYRAEAVKAVVGLCTGVN
jgi:hypothetical protein